MKIKKEGSENNPRFKLMEGGITLREIEKWYGKETAAALVQYCDAMEKEIDDVAGDDKEWDRFEMWSKSKKRGLGTNSGKFNDWQKASRIDDKGDVQRAITRYDVPVSSDIYGEESGSRMDEFDILNWIYEEMRDCEWAEIDKSDISGDKAEFEVALPGPDGDVFRVSVQKIWSGRLGQRLD